MWRNASLWCVSQLDTALGGEWQRQRWGQFWYIPNAKIMGSVLAITCQLFDVHVEVVGEACCVVEGSTAVDILQTAVMVCCVGLTSWLIVCPKSNR